jgi:DNA-directed RNA polymerase subunit M/transcription elongation factor TFIIS
MSDILLPDDAPVKFRCPQCQSPLKVPAALAGKLTRCPRCQMSLKVPLRSRPDDKGEEYAVHEGPGPSAAEREKYILIICPVCHGRMHATERQIGQQVSCPECGTPSIVKRSPEQAAKKPVRTAKEIGDYPVAAGAVARSTPAPAEEQTYIPVPCSLCHTRMLATLDQVGGWLVCPDCGTATEVPPPPPPKRKIDVMAGAGPGYGLIGYDETRPQATAPQPPLPRDADVEPRAPEPRLIPRRKRRRLPEHPFLEGTFSFPFLPSVRVRTLVLMGWAFLPSIMVFTARSAGAMTPTLGSAAIIYWFFCAMLMSAAVVITMMWYVVASATLMVVMRESAEGCEVIEDWPGPVFTDWILDALWIFIGFAVSVAPGAAIVWLLGDCGALGDAIMAAGMFFVFPIVMMSMLEMNTMFGVISWPVLRSLFTTTGGWLKFYAASGALVATTLAIEYLVSWLNLDLGLIIGAMVQVIVWMIYFRLLGRLGWYCAARSARAELEATLDEVLEDDDSEEPTAD